jgi:hypothetical protein
LIIVDQNGQFPDSMTGMNNQNFPVQSQSGTILLLAILFEIFKLQVNGHHLLLKQ